MVINLIFKKVLQTFKTKVWTKQALATAKVWLQAEGYQPRKWAIITNILLQ